MKNCSHCMVNHFMQEGTLLTLSAWQPGIENSIHKSPITHGLHDDRMTDPLKPLFILLFFSIHLPYTIHPNCFPFKHVHDYPMFPFSTSSITFSSLPSIHWVLFPLILRVLLFAFKGSIAWQLQSFFNHSAVIYHSTTEEIQP